MLRPIIDLWFVFVTLSLVVTVYDIRNTPVSWVQKLGWILVVIYTGPFGLFFYLLTCHAHDVAAHDLFTQASWKQAVNSEVHCLAGDATGIIIAAIFLFYYPLSHAREVVIEYVAGFVSGWFIFQAGMMRSMYSSYFQSLRRTFFAEAVSMNFVMMGMIPCMLILMGYFPFSRDPSSLQFWFVMGISTLIGGFLAYPINYWLVNHRLKHGCMTLGMANMEMAGHDMEHHDDEQKMEMQTLTSQEQMRIIGITFAMLLFAVFMTMFLLSLNL